MNRLLAACTTAVDATATSTGKKSANTGISSVPRPKPEKSVSSDTPNAAIPTQVADAAHEIAGQIRFAQPIREAGAAIAAHLGDQSEQDALLVLASDAPRLLEMQGARAVPRPGAVLDVEDAVDLDLFAREDEEGDPILDRALEVVNRPEPEELDQAA